MSELDGIETDAAGTAEVIEDNSDEDLAAAYEALDEDRRLRDEERRLAPDADQTQLDRSEPQEVVENSGPGSTGGGATLEQTVGAEAHGELLDGSLVADQQVTATMDRGSTSATTPTRRVFVIDAKEYPDPDAQLPITGARSVQAMHLDYFPGQLDNVDVVQKTRSDGTLEVTFKRRIGTKGTGVKSSGRPRSISRGEVGISISGVVRVLRSLPADRPLAWALVEQAIDTRGRVRLDFVPPAAELNLAEAQQSARARLIEQALAELRCIRPSV
jgi:hypothetical protein